MLRTKVVRLLVLSVVTANAQPTSNIERPVCFPLGVAQTDGRIGYIMNFNKGIDAIDLESGRMLWRTNLASRPLIAYDQSLVAGAVGNKSNVMKILLLSKDGRARMQSTVAFPEWVKIQPIDGPSFTMTAALNRDHKAEELLLEWQAHSKYVEGANPPPFIENAEKRDASGEFSVDLKTGRVKKGTSNLIASGPDFPKQSEKDLISRINEPGAQHACLLGRRIHYVQSGPDECSLKARTSDSLRLLWVYVLPCKSSPRPPPLKK